MKTENCKLKIHLVGIGGIGISALAKIYLQKGHQVQGSDQESSEITKELQKRGVKIFIGHKKENLKPKPDFVIYSEAVPPRNPEILAAKRLKIKCLSGAQTIRELSKDYFTIAVSGMHGKSTTASMIAGILVKAGLDPTFIIGTKPGARTGRSRYLIIEADDYKAKFLNYKPEILVLTNIEEEHLDYFKNLHHILRIFKQYTNQVKEKIVANKDDENVMKVLISNFQFPISKQKVNLYSLKDKEAGKLKRILRVPGIHNVSNALAALNTARLMGINDEISFKALSEYKGVWRRFEEKSLKIVNCKLKIISDYAHHPTEIKATLQALLEKYSKDKKWVIFQPHQYQRTFYLFNDFVKTFQQARKKFGIEKIIITDIYSVKGRESEAIKKKVNSQKLVKAINRDFVEYMEQNKIGDFIKKNASPNMVLAILGAGDIYKLPEQF